MRDLSHLLVGAVDVSRRNDGIRIHVDGRDLCKGTTAEARLPRQLNALDRPLVAVVRQEREIRSGLTTCFNRYFCRFARGEK